MGLSGFTAAGLLMAGAVSTGAPPPPIDAAAAPAAPAAVAPAATAPTREAQTKSDCCVIPMGAVVIVEFVNDVSSKTQKAGDKFALRLVEPLTVDGRMVLAAGATGAGEVVDAAPPGMGGRAGKLVLAARYLERGDQRIPIRSLKVGGAGSGRDNATAALVVSEAGALAFAPLAFAGMVVTGGNADYPAGTRAVAKVSAEVTLPPLTDSTPASLAPSQPTANTAAGVSATAGVPPPSQASTTRKDPTP